jgi:hypothetical protein
MHLGIPSRGSESGAGWLGGDPEGAVQASQTRLINLLEGERQFQVPLYQRTYTWIERNLKQLWTTSSARRSWLKRAGKVPTS